MEFLLWPLIRAASWNGKSKCLIALCTRENPSTKPRLWETLQAKEINFKEINIEEGSTFKKIKRDKSMNCNVWILFRVTNKPQSKSTKIWIQTNETLKRVYKTKGSFMLTGYLILGLFYFLGEIIIIVYLFDKSILSFKDI